mmetsp:Transcript_42665/g.114280  ORF Transcript_42665/g.114280 Transcript_42665/m.114280 type:complete len:435 (-) Transcript_42665:74-1378(-)
MANAALAGRCRRALVNNEWAVHHCASLRAHLHLHLYLHLRSLRSLLSISLTGSRSTLEATDVAIQGSISLDCSLCSHNCTGCSRVLLCCAGRWPGWNLGDHCRGGILGGSPGFHVLRILAGQLDVERWVGRGLANDHRHAGVLVEAKLCLQLWVLARRKQHAQTRHGRLARADGGFSVGEQLQARPAHLVANGHEVVAAGLEDAPRERAHLLAVQAHLDGAVGAELAAGWLHIARAARRLVRLVHIALRLDGAAVGVSRLDRDKARPVLLERVPEVTTQARSQSADAAVGKHVGRELVRADDTLAVHAAQLLQHLGGEQGVARVDTLGNGLVALARAVLDQVPSVVLAVVVGLLARLLVGTLDADHVGAERPHLVRNGVADGAAEVDLGLAPGALGAPGDAEAVVAGRGGGDHLVVARGGGWPWWCRAGRGGTG